MWSYGNIPWSEVTLYMYLHCEYSGIMIYKSFKRMLIEYDHISRKEKNNGEMRSGKFLLNIT